MSRHDRHLPETHRRPRLLALPLVLACAVAYLGGALHFTLVQHATCLEHGEAVHVADAGLHAQPRVAETSFADARLARASQVATVAHGAEAHCAHAFFRREAPPPATHAPLIAEATPSSERLPPATGVHPEPVARLRLAPKSSPPLS